ncbi:hypothetical protein F5X97DRAFT_220293 [Nemania serpens]|nr:hypothetical protein F5X97DRAFT_220293 [Nemania serpens]
MGSARWGHSLSKAADVAHEFKDRWIRKGTLASDAFRVISEATLQPCAAAVSRDDACKLICSYNWQDSKESRKKYVRTKNPLIRVPGFAPIWRPVSRPLKLPPDKGVYFRDQNAAQMPKSPFGPVFRAAEAMNPTINFADVDIVINRNSLTKFHSFCAGNVKDSFRVELSMINNTLFIERREQNAQAYYKGEQADGWGHNFAKAITQPLNGLSRSPQHYRVLGYPLGGLNCVVRSEVDACYEEGSQGQQQNAGDDTREDAIVHLDKPYIGPGSKKKSIVSGTESPVAKRDEPMLQSTAAEIKTGKRGRPIRGLLPQLWFGRIPWFIMGYHAQGTFDEIEIVNTEAELIAWESEHQAELRKLVTLLSELRETAKKSGFQRCIATCEKRTRPLELKIFGSASNRRPLTGDFIDKFWRDKSDEAAVKGTK